MKFEYGGPKRRIPSGRILQENQCTKSFRSRLFACLPEEIFESIVLLSAAEDHLMMEKQPQLMIQIFDHSKLKILSLSKIGTNYSILEELLSILFHL